jgi:hypothetical protein
MLYYLNFYGKFLGYRQYPKQRDKVAILKIISKREIPYYDLIQFLTIFTVVAPFIRPIGASEIWI